ncbi:MAG TPA: BamA/TamA family outer membrane protein [Blastocatellia bacterium]|nr:BamA/TamA family outer membrane protein [Blastocatellia bacterium]
MMIAVLLTVLMSLASACYSSAYVSLSLFQARQFRIGRIEFKGNERVRELIIRRMIPLQEGDIFNQVKWEEGLEQINRSGLFEPVSPGDAVLTLDERNGIVDIVLHLKERDHQRIDISAGGGSTGGASVGLDYANINLSGRADRFFGRLRIGSRERSFAAGYSIQPLTKTPLVFEAAGFFHRLELVEAGLPESEREPLYIERTGGASLGLSFPLSRTSYPFSATTTARILYSFNYTYLTDSLAATSPGVRSIDADDIRIGSITSMIEHNTLDRNFDPRNGLQLITAIEASGRALGGNINTLMPYFDLRAFIATGPKGSSPATGSREPHVLGFRFRASHVYAFGRRFRPDTLSAVDGVPVFKRFFTGGESEIRGFDVRSLSPLARIDRVLAIPGSEAILVSSELRPVGADTKLFFNAEYRVPLVWRLSAAAFFDIGAAFNARALKRERFETGTRVDPGDIPAILVTLLGPLTDGEDVLPDYRISLGAELRFPIPVLNLPLRLIFAANPNAQRPPPGVVFIAPEKKLAFRFGFSRTL